MTGKTADRQRKAAALPDTDPVPALLFGHLPVFGMNSEAQLRCFCGLKQKAKEKNQDGAIYESHTWKNDCVKFGKIARQFVVLP